MQVYASTKEIHHIIVALLRDSRNNILCPLWFTIRTLNTPALQTRITAMVLTISLCLDLKSSDFIVVKYPLHEKTLSVPRHYFAGRGGWQLVRDWRRPAWRVSRNAVMSRSGRMDQLSHIRLHSLADRSRYKSLVSVQVCSQLQSFVVEYENTHMPSNP